MLPAVYTHPHQTRTVTAAGQTAVQAPAKPQPTPTPSALAGADQVTLSATATPADLKVRLAPIFRLIEQTGYPEVAARLRNAHYKLTDGKAFGIEYYAAAWPGGIVTFNRNAFRELSDKELAAVLIHEGTHLGQNLGAKAASNVVSLGGRVMKHNFTEREAYLVQWEAMRRLGVTSGEIYYACLYSLQDMGIHPADAPKDA